MVRLGRDEAGVVHRSAGILSLLSERPDGLTLSELARRLGWSRSSAHRLLGQMEAVGFVRRDPQTQTFRVGLFLVRLVGDFVQHLDVHQVAYPHMQRLREETGETVTLQILSERQAICVAAIESVHDLRLAGRIGFATPFGAGANGLILQAFQPAQQWREADPARVARLERIRALGFCATCGERVPGAWAIAAPVCGSGGDVAACVSLRGPATRFAAAAAVAGTLRLLAAAADISRELGAAAVPPAADRGVVEVAMRDLERRCRSGQPAGP